MSKNHDIHRCAKNVTPPYPRSTLVCGCAVSGELINMCLKFVVYSLVVQLIVAV